ncbi:hypothetical protein AAAW23_002447 [Cronobacter sakazakii]
MSYTLIGRIKKIIAQFDSSYEMSKLVDERHDELDEAVKASDIDSAIRSRMEQMGVRREVIGLAMESVEYEEILASMTLQLTGVIARYDLADQIDSARDAA